MTLSYREKVILYTMSFKPNTTVLSRSLNFMKLYESYSEEERKDLLEECVKPVLDQQDIKTQIMFMSAESSGIDPLQFATFIIDNGLRTDTNEILTDLFSKGKDS